MSRHHGPPGGVDRPQEKEPLATNHGGTSERQRHFADGAVAALLHRRCAKQVILGAVNQHVIVTVEDRLAQWRAAEKAAVEAEARVHQLGPGTADVALRDFARELREKANWHFARTVRAVQLDELEGEAGRS